MPERIQMSRQRPWRLDHPDAVIVSRPHLLSNPFHIGSIVTVTAGANMAVVRMSRHLAVDCYRDHLTMMLLDDPDDMPEDRAVTLKWRRAVEALRGRDVACWCPLDESCHADVLLEIANA